MSTMSRGAKLALGVSALPLMAGSAWAAASGAVSTANITFATQAVSAASGAITLPASGGNSDAIVYTTGTLTGAAASTGSFTLVFTLPSGVTTASATATVANVAGTPCTTGTITGAVASNTITFTVTTTNTGAATNSCSVTLGALSLTGATALSTATTSSATAGFTIAAQVTTVTNSTVPADATAAKAALASSASALSFTGITTPTVGTASDQIDTSGNLLAGVKSFGKAFTSGTANEQLVAASAAGGSGAFTTVLSTTALNAAATGPFLATGTTGTIALTGNLSGVASMFLDTSSATATCATTSSSESSVSSAISGTISGSTATFLNVGAGPQTLCVYAGGTSLLGTNPNGIQIGATFGGASASGANGSSTPTGIYNTSYSQGTPYFVTYAGNLSGYPSFVRVVNNTTTSVQVYAEVQTDNGSLGTGAVTSSLPAQTNTLVADSSILTSAGVSPDATGRASFILWSVPTNGNIENAGTVSFGPGAVGISHLLVNPNGTVVQLGGNNSP